LVAGGADLPAVMQAGRSKSPTMPARYPERLLAGRGAVARYYERRGGWCEPRHRPDRARFNQASPRTGLAVVQMSSS
jgi:hypothetical protein